MAQEISAATARYNERALIDMCLALQTKVDQLSGSVARLMPGTRPHIEEVTDLRVLDLTQLS